MKDNYIMRAVVLAYLIITLLQDSLTACFLGFVLVKLRQSQSHKFIVIVLTLQLISATCGSLYTLVLAVYLKYLDNDYVAKIAFSLFNVVWFATYS